MENERDELNNEITSLKDDVNCLLDNHFDDPTKQSLQISTKESIYHDKVCEEGMNGTQDPTRDNTAPKTQQLRQTQVLKLV